MTRRPKRGGTPRGRADRASRGRSARRSHRRGFGPLDLERARHAEVHHQGVAGRQGGQQVLRPPCEREHASGPPAGHGSRLETEPGGRAVEARRARCVRRSDREPARGEPLRLRAARATSQDSSLNDRHRRPSGRQSELNDVITERCASLDAVATGERRSLSFAATVGHRCRTRARRQCGLPQLPPRGDVEGVDRGIEWACRR